MTETDQPSQSRQRLIVIGLFALFGFPIVLATVLNSTWKEWAPAVTRNHGQLVQPVEPLNGIDVEAWQDAAGDRWTLLVGADRCAAECQRLMETLHNVQRALGRRSDRVRRRLLLSEPMALEPAPDLTVEVDRQRTEAFLGRWPADTELVLVDPLGNVMMRYPSGFDPTGLRKDLERLLKYSKAGH